MMTTAPRNNSKANLAIGILVVLSLIVIALAVLNVVPVTIKLFGAAVSLSLGVIFGATYVLGLVAGTQLYLIKIAQDKTSEKRLEDWQVQDAKLAASVQTDREKQLEAKIATLESALQRALKK